AVYCASVPMMRLASAIIPCTISPAGLTSFTSPTLWPARSSIDSTSPFATAVGGRAAKTRHRHRHSSDDGLSDRRLACVQGRRFGLARQPCFHEGCAQCAMGRVRPAISEKSSAHSVFFARGDELLLVERVSVGLGRGEETRSHHDPIRPERKGGDE